MNKNLTLTLAIALAAFQTSFGLAPKKEDVKVAAQQTQAKENVQAETPKRNYLSAKCLFNYAVAVGGLVSMGLRIKEGYASIFGSDSKTKPVPKSRLENFETQAHWISSALIGSFITYKGCKGALKCWRSR